MSDYTNWTCSCAGERSQIEVRYHQAKEAMLQAQQQHCEATYEFLAARAEVRQILETVFPEPELRGERETLNPAFSETWLTLRG